MLVADWNGIPSPGNISFNMHCFMCMIQYQFFAALTIKEPRYGDLRLVRGTVTDGTFSSGRLEIYVNGQWGTICDDYFDQTDANVACKQLGFSRANSYRASASGGYERSTVFATSSALNSMYCMCRFNYGSGPIWLDDLRCRASDTRLISCPHRGTGSHNCGHSEDIAVYCNSKWQSAYFIVEPYCMHLKSVILGLSRNAFSTSRSILYSVVNSCNTNYYDQLSTHMINYNMPMFFPCVHDSYR